MNNHMFGSSQSLLHLAQVRMHPAHHLLALISAAGASPDARLIKLDIEHHVVGV